MAFLDIRLALLDIPVALTQDRTVAVHNQLQPLVLPHPSHT